MIVCSIIFNICVAKKEVGTANQIVPNCSSYHSTSGIFLQEEVFHFRSENTLLQQQFIQSSNTYVADYIENSKSRKLQLDSPSTCSFYEI